MTIVIITQLLLPGASAYERKSQAIDAAALPAEHDVRLGDLADADIVHIYAPRILDPAALRDITLPFVSNAHPKAARFNWRKERQPARVITPLKDPTPTHEISAPQDHATATADDDTARRRERKIPPLETFIPEAVDDRYFELATKQPGTRATVGTFSRPSIRNIVEQTATRIHRFRDDVDWLLFDEQPSLDDLRGVDIWVDPAVEEDDADGFVAEAVAAGKAVVASRTALNSQRLEKGRTGFLVPHHDPNELTHAILAALFKSERTQNIITASQQTVSKFRARHRVRALIQLYESILQ
ncbi:MAG TPA: glycosyltransferase [Thermoanaerobaculia bacterium]|jgi:hypothetical protein|nr:glycosyltransferase [Thermoanaerobaculia bacterium]